MSSAGGDILFLHSCSILTTSTLPLDILSSKYKYNMALEEPPNITHYGSWMDPGSHQPIQSRPTMSMIITLSRIFLLVSNDSKILRQLDCATAEEWKLYLTCIL